VGSTFNVCHELIKQVRWVREELANAQERVEWTRRFVNLNLDSFKGFSAMYLTHEQNKTLEREKELPMIRAWRAG
jgi:hypothetical protein